MEAQVQKDRLMFHYELGESASDRTARLYVKLIRCLRAFDMVNGRLQILWTAERFMRDRWLYIVFPPRDQCIL